MLDYADYGGSTMIDTMTKKDFLNFNPKYERIFMPNEIFADFRSSFNNATHISFAYSYYYLVSYLYRYVKYSTKSIYSQKLLYNYLGHSYETKNLLSITKKNGKLDEIGYTETTTDYPIMCDYDENSKPIFTTIKKYKKDDIYHDGLGIIYDNGYDRNFKVKYPVKGFFRDQESKEDGFYNGTFYEIENTHEVPIGRFIKAMQIPDVGTMGFFLYSFLLRKNDMHKDGYHAPRSVISTETLFSERTISKYIAILEEYRFIDIHQEKRKINVYRVVR